MSLFSFANTPEEAFGILTSELKRLYLHPEVPLEKEIPVITQTRG